MRYRPGIRLLGLFLILGGSFAVVGGRLVWVQAFASDTYAALGVEQRERRFELPPQRGSIFDRDRAELALSMDMKTIFANPRFVPDPAGAAERMAPVLGTEVEEISSKLRRDAGFVYLLRKADPAVADAAMALGIPGISTAPESKRFYPTGQLAAHVLGFVGLDNQGLGGIEHRYDELLRGRPGELLMERDPAGRPIPAGKSHFVPPTAGSDLVLTIDREIQYAAETALRKAMQRWSASGGTVVVMLPSTGEILALANEPTFDPNDPLASPAHARRNRAFADVYEPGSANKVITAAAAIESGVVGPSDVVNVPDRFTFARKIFRDAHPHPTLDLTFAQVIEQSSNVGTIKVATTLGKDRLYEYLRKFGYGNTTGAGFPGESGGILPKPEGWWDTSLPTIAIGQGVAVTPMQIVGVYATVANRGVAVTPRLIAATVEPGGRRIDGGPSKRRRVIKEETARTLTSILLGVTEHREGTGKAAAITGYQVAGKTGTAQKIAPDGRGYAGHISSFIGFAPAGDPKLVVGVVLDDPSPIWGGVTAAPAFREVMQFALRHLGIGPGPVLRIEGAPLPAPVRSGGAGPPAADATGTGATTD